MRYWQSKNGRFTYPNLPSCTFIQWDDESVIKPINQLKED